MTNAQPIADIVRDAVCVEKLVMALVLVIMAHAIVSQAALQAGDVTPIARVTPVSS